MLLRIYKDISVRKAFGRTIKSISNFPSRLYKNVLSQWRYNQTKPDRCISRFADLPPWHHEFNKAAEPGLRGNGRPASRSFFSPFGFRRRWRRRRWRRYRYMCRTFSFVDFHKRGPGVNFLTPLERIRARNIFKWPRDYTRSLTLIPFQTSARLRNLSKSTRTPLWKLSMKLRSHSTSIKRTLKADLCAQKQTFQPSNLISRFLRDKPKRKLSWGRD